MQALPRALQAAQDRQDDRRKGQASLLDLLGGSTDNASPVTRTSEPLPEVPPWPETEKLQYEKEVLDFYFSNHPLTLYEKEMRKLATHKVADLKGVPDGQEVTVGGMLLNIRLRTTQRVSRNGNNQFAAFALEDFTGSFECVIWSDELPRNKEALKDDKVVVLRGQVSRRKDPPLLVVSRVLTLEQAAQEMASKLWLQLNLSRHRPSHIDVIAEILRRTPGSCPVNLLVVDPAGRQVVLKLGRAFNVNPATYAREDLEGLLGRDAVRLV